MLGRISVTSLAVLMAAASPAAATFVHSVSPSNGMPTNATLVSYDFTDHIGQDPGPFPNEDYTGAASGNVNFTNLEMNVVQQNAPFDVEITRVGGPTQQAEYWFQATLHNLTNAPIQNLSIALLSNPNTLAPAILRGTTFRRIRSSPVEPTRGSATRWRCSATSDWGWARQRPSGSRSISSAWRRRRSSAITRRCSCSSLPRPSRRVCSWAACASWGWRPS